MTAADVSQLLTDAIAARAYEAHYDQAWAKASNVTRPRFLAGAAEHVEPVLAVLADNGLVIVKQGDLRLAVTVSRDDLRRVLNDEPPTDVRRAALARLRDVLENPL